MGGDALVKVHGVRAPDAIVANVALVIRHVMKDERSHGSTQTEARAAMGGAENCRRRGSGISGEDEMRLFGPSVLGALARLARQLSGRVVWLIRRRGRHCQETTVGSCFWVVFYCGFEGRPILLAFACCFPLDFAMHDSLSKGHNKYPCAGLRFLVERDKQAACHGSLQTYASFAVAFLHRGREQMCSASARQPFRSSLPRRNQTSV